MVNHTSEEKEKALQLISSAIVRCEKAQLKFSEGSSQHSLLKNRLKALHISKALIMGENMDACTKEELTEALQPLSSIIGKCEKAQRRFAEGTPYHTRFKSMILAMNNSMALITDELGKRAVKSS